MAASGVQSLAWGVMCDVTCDVLGCGCDVMGCDVVGWWGGREGLVMER